jgi:uncharacterized protein (TIRG00374 family)
MAGRGHRRQLREVPLKTTVRISASIAVAAVLIVALMVWGEVSPKDALATIRSLPPRVYALALLMHVTLYCLRALRFNLLIPRERRPSFRRALIVAGAHNMASYLLPAKTGEASFVVYMRLQCGVPSATGLASLLVSRMLDAAMMCLGISAACLWLVHTGRYTGLTWLGSAGMTLIGLCVVFTTLSVRGDLLVRLIAAVLRWLRLHRLKLGERALLKANQLALALRSAGGNGRLVLAALVTIPIWLLVFGFFAVLAKAMGLPEHFTFAEATFGSSLAVMFNLLPVNGVAGVGTQEAGWVTGFSQFLGVDRSLALSTGIGCHVVQLFNIVVMGIAAHVAMGAMPRQRLDDVEATPVTGSPALPDLKPPR